MTQPQETQEKKVSIRDVFEPGFIIEVAFNTGKVLKFKDGDNSEPQDYSQIFQSLVKAGIFRDSDNSYTIQFDDGRIELAFERTEGAEGPVFRIVIADKARRIKDILKEETFEDLRYALKGDVAELFRNGIRYETVRVKEIEKDITERILREKQNFYSIEGPEFGIASFRAANTAGEAPVFCIRRLGAGFGFIDTYGDDILFIKFFSTVLSGHGTNRSILVSGGTNQGKTSVLISLMNFLNTYSLDAIYKHLYIKGLAKIRPEYASLDPKSVTREYLEKQIREILPVDQAEIIIQGTVEYIRDSGLNRLLSSFSGRSIFTMEKPIERRFVNDALSFTQTDISFNDMDEDDINAFKSGKTFDEVSTRKFLLQSNVALQSNPALMYVSEVKREEYEKYLEVILQGIPTLATNHAGSIWQNLERIMAVQEDEKSAKQSIIGGMGGMINFRRYAADDESFLFSYEYLIMTDDILTRFRNTSVKEFEKVITVSMMPKEYIRHEYSLIRQIYTRFLKTGASVGIKTYGMPEYSDLMSDFNIEKVSKFYGFDFGELQSFQVMYLDEMKKREDKEI